MPGAEASRPAGPLVPPAPLNEVCQVAQVTGGDGNPLVCLIFHGPYGMVHHFLGGLPAATIGAELVRLGNLSAAGLMAPPNGTLPAR